MHNIVVVCGSAATCASEFSQMSPVLFGQPTVMISDISQTEKQTATDIKVRSLRFADFAQQKDVRLWVGRLFELF